MSLDVEALDRMLAFANGVRGDTSHGCQQDLKEATPIPRKKRLPLATAAVISNLQLEGTYENHSVAIAKKSPASLGTFSTKSGNDLPSNSFDLPNRILFGDSINHGVTMEKKSTITLPILAKRSEKEKENSPRQQPLRQKSSIFLNQQPPPPPKSVPPPGAIRRLYSQGVKMDVFQGKRHGGKSIKYSEQRKKNERKRKQTNVKRGSKKILNKTSQKSKIIQSRAQNENDKKPIINQEKKSKATPTQTRSLSSDKKKKISTKSASQSKVMTSPELIEAIERKEALKKKVAIERKRQRVALARLRAERVTRERSVADEKSKKQLLFRRLKASRAQRTKQKKNTFHGGAKRKKIHDGIAHRVSSGGKAKNQRSGVSNQTKGSGRNSVEEKLSEATTPVSSKKRERRTADPEVFRLKEELRKAHANAKAFAMRAAKDVSLLQSALNKSIEENKHLSECLKRETKRCNKMRISLVEAETRAKIAEEDLAAVLSQSENTSKQHEEGRKKLNAVCAEGASRALVAEENLAIERRKNRKETRSGEQHALRVTYNSPQHRSLLKTDLIDEQGDQKDTKFKSSDVELQDEYSAAFHFSLRDSMKDNVGYNNTTEMKPEMVRNLAEAMQCARNSPIKNSDSILHSSISKSLAFPISTIDFTQSKAHENKREKEEERINPVDSSLLDIAYTSRPTRHPPTQPSVSTSAPASPSGSFTRCKTSYQQNEKSIPKSKMAVSDLEFNSVEGTRPSSIEADVQKAMLALKRKYGLD